MKKKKLPEKVQWQLDYNKQLLTDGINLWSEIDLVSKVNTVIAANELSWMYYEYGLDTKDDTFEEYAEIYYTLKTKIYNSYDKLSEEEKKHVNSRLD